MGAYRPAVVDGAHPMAATLEGFARHDWCEVIPVEGLDREEIRELLTCLSGRPVGREWAARIADHTGGNPFLLRQLLPLLDRYDLARPPADGDESLPVPRGVRDAVRARLARLPRSSREVLDAAAVLGPEIGLAVLGRATERDVDSLELDVRTAREADLLRDSGPGSCAFTHALVQEAVLAELSDARKAELHVRAGVAFETGDETSASVRLAALAHHFHQGASGQKSRKAVEYLLRAGRDSAERFAYREADDRFGRALEMLDPEAPGAEAARCDLLCERGWIRHRLGMADTRAVFLEAAQIARALGDGERLARAAEGYTRGREGSLEDPLDEEMKLLSEALALLGDANAALRVQLLQLLASRHRTLGDVPRARELLDRADRELALQPVGPIYGEVAEARAYLAWGEETPERVVAIAERLTELGDSVGALDPASHGVRLRMCAHVVLADLEAADRDHAELERRTHEHGLQGWIPTLLAHRVMRSLLRGRLDEAEQLSQEQLQVSVGYEERAALSWHVAQVGLIKEARGELASLEPALRSYADRKVDPMTHASVGVVYARIGRLEEALRHYRHALGSAGPEAIPHNEWRLGTVGLLAECCALLGDREWAASFRRLLEPERDHLIVTGHAVFWYPPGAYVLGLLSRAEGDFDGAVESLERAAALCERIDAPLWVARMRFHQARALVARGRDGDRELALGRLADVLATAERLDLAGLRKSASATAAEL